MILALSLLSLAAGAEIEASTSAITVTEAGAEAELVVTLSDAPAGLALVTVQLGGTDEAIVSPSLLFFAAGQAPTSQLVVVRGLDDDHVDGDQTFALTLDGTSGEEDVGTFVVDGLTEDDDRRGLDVTPSSGIFLTEAGLEDQLQVALTSRPDAAVDVVVSPVVPGEVEVLQPMLSFDAIDWHLPKTVGVRGLDDWVADGDRAWVLHVTTSTTDPDWAAVPAMEVDGVTLDDDLPGLIVSPSVPLTVSEAGETAAVTVRLRSQPRGAVVVTVDSADLTEVSAYPATLEFGESNWDVPQSLVLAGLDDDYDDGDRAVRVILTPTSVDDPTYEALLGEEIAVMNLDDNVDQLKPGETLDSVSVTRWVQGGLGCDQGRAVGSVGALSLLLAGWAGGRRRGVRARR